MLFIFHSSHFFTIGFYSLLESVFFSFFSDKSLFNVGILRHTDDFKLDHKILYFFDDIFGYDPYVHANANKI